MSDEAYEKFRQFAYWFAVCASAACFAISFRPNVETHEKWIDIMCSLYCATSAYRLRK